MKKSLPFQQRNNNDCLPMRDRKPFPSSDAGSEMSVCRRGAILFLAVGSIAVLSILAMGATSSVMQELKLARLVADSQVAPEAVLSAVKAAKIFWQADLSPQAVTFFDLRPRTIALGDVRADVVFIDEQAKINIDRAPVNILALLPGLLGQAELVNAIAGASIAQKEELLFLPGMTPEIYDGLKSSVTVYGDGRVNMNTAGEETLSFLGIDNGFFAVVSAYRAGDDAVEATDDDRFFSNIAEIVPRLESYGITPEQKDVLENLIATNAIGVQSDNIRMVVDVKRGNKSLKNFEVVVNRALGTIVSWQEE